MIKPEKQTKEPFADWREATKFVETFLYAHQGIGIDGANCDKLNRILRAAIQDARNEECSKCGTVTS